VWNGKADIYIHHAAHCVIVLHGVSVKKKVKKEISGKTRKNKTFKM
jgi:hypothetical protein